MEQAQMRIGLRIGLLLRLISLALVFGSGFGSVPVLAEGGKVVALELVLLVDVSASVDSEEYRLQVDGLAAALRSSAVLSSIGSLSGKGIAIAVVQWGDEANQRMAIEWSMLRRDADALWLASQIDSMPRLIDGGHTALSSALAFAAREIEGNRFSGLRRIIDVAGDGRNNSGPPLRTVRREVLSQGITINGLAILNELPLLDRYFRDHLIGGDGAFYVVAKDYDDFTQAMSEKLVREISSVPLSENNDPKSFPKRINGISMAARSKG